MKKVLLLFVLAVLGGAAFTAVVRRRAEEAVLPAEGFSGEVPLSAVHAVREAS